MAMIFGSTVLEVAIGIVFVYLLLSLLCSAVCEYIEAKFNNRAKYLRQGINLLLNESKGGGVDLAQRLLDHGLVRPFYRDANRPPSYIPSRIFALALWNMATTEAAGFEPGRASDGPSAAGVTTDLKQIRRVIATRLPNQELKTALLTLIDEANGDLEKARKNVEDWYDGMMDRVSGWYKRRTSVILLALGFVVAAIVNADTIDIAKALARDGALRSSLVAAAERRLATPLTALPDAVDAEEKDKAASENLRQARAAVDTLGLPIGWVRATNENSGDPRRNPTSAGGWMLKLFGLLLTGFAISQGSPFWFDLLNKFMVIRSTVKPAEKSQEQPSKDRRAAGDIGKTEDGHVPPGR
jgi:hypothetical protein